MTSPVHLAVLADAAVITVKTGGEHTDDYKQALMSAAKQGFVVLQDEYFDPELDAYVYVLTEEEE